jgi:uncharacterized membrane protein
MHPKDFLSQLDEDRIIAAIAEAEKKTSGEIRVYISHKKRQDAMAFAQKRFLDLGMDKTRDRNAVLIYIVPLTRQFAVIGDTAVHEKCGNAFWQEVAALMTQSLKEELFTAAIVRAVEKIGQLLAAHFPRRPDDTNELPNQIVRD